MKRVLSAMKNWRPRLNLNSTIGFFLLSVALVWLKTYWAYNTKFNLGVSGGIQEFLLFFNPIPTALILLGIALYFRGRVAYYLMLLINLIQSIWLFANILYYREFSDFLSFSIMGSGSSVDNNLSKAIAGIITPSDFLVFADIIILVILLATRVIKIDKRAVAKRIALLTTVLGAVLVLVGYGVASSDRSGLLTRTFDNNYIVKYLGLNEYAAYNAIKTKQTADERANASVADLAPIEKFVKQQNTTPNPAYYGALKGKNIIMIHLESFQQFLIDYKVDGKEVTPNINKFYHEQNTLGFSNFYNQVGQGKTSDAEMMLDNSLYGTASGSAMTNYGATNTFQSMEGYLDQDGYTTAAFHGDVPSFWNREATYKSWGFDYFFSKAYYKDADNPAYNVGYGLKDKIFMKDTANYLQQLPQPYFAKVITLTNHYPYTLDKENIDFPATKTGDKTVDGYVQTAHYLDESFGELMAYLQKSGMDKNTAVILYGDHYGISENHKPAIAKLLGKTSVTNYDLANWEKVPFMINAPGLKGGINNTYGGEIDVMPTLMDLLGISDTNTIHFGTDLLAAAHKQIVAFRNGDWVTNEYMKHNGQYFVTATGTLISPKADPRVEQIVKQTQSYVNTSLSYSDKVITGDLLRFFKTNTDFKKINRKDYSYNKGTSLKKLKAEQKLGTSLMAQNNNQTTIGDYETNAPELTDNSNASSNSDQSTN
ncbi:phosphatidylglycerol-membrane-oligosaccharide glycerophosphotransferase [Weissella oryzae SG25]|uniref:Phosphatidylglycerol-membrane-oligosaccharide glycerophosphotransferase n=1 Tax=Weissella oryzae (strain DSM 25784 / JCM 18191 / LMG 30913 / SG25) TaxID=1329250 RepID=A0A069CUF8_WEIOS|nr:LTA synthase family protein [Weissella oryzae]GAK31435.1 phosphatidylglycerol-membrane-oligosaccharide glycerophosphotransferase [Weissella oryzae SG25]